MSLHIVRKGPIEGFHPEKQGRNSLFWRRGDVRSTHTLRAERALPPGGPSWRKKFDAGRIDPFPVADQKRCATRSDPFIAEVFCFDIAVCVQQRKLKLWERNHNNQQGHKK